MSQATLARAGGGGSSSAGESSGSGSSVSLHSSSRSSDGDGLVSGATGAIITVGMMVVFLFIFFSVFIRRSRLEKQREVKRQKKLVQELAPLAARDPLWKLETLQAHSTETFIAFQKAWGNGDLSVLKELLTTDYHKRIILELGVLEALGRKNVMENLKIKEVVIYSFDAKKKSFVAAITASAKDVLYETSVKAALFSSDESFTEYWEFAREGNGWKLSVIRQKTEAEKWVEKDIAEFAKKNNFYFDPDFGWLMLPSKGVLFNRRSFGESDVNNHVIGYHRNKIVEFYTYCQEKNYLVAQAVLPIKYENILITKRQWFKGDPKGLRKVELESVDFNKKFLVWASPKDEVNSLELLTPDFMEKIYSLPYELNIEVVGNILYFYTEDREANGANYAEMLWLMSSAFDAMKM